MQAKHGDLKGTLNEIDDFKAWQTAQFFKEKLLDKSLN